MRITFTKVFATGSLLAGVTFAETIERANATDLAHYAALAESGEIVNTGAYGGSDYTVTNVVADLRGTLPLIEVEFIEEIELTL